MREVVRVGVGGSGVRVANQIESQWPPSLPFNFSPR